MRELIGYIEEGTSKPKLFCQNTKCRNFMTIVDNAKLPTTPFQPRRTDVPFRPRKLP